MLVMTGEMIYNDYKKIGSDYARIIEIAIGLVGKETVFELLEECERDEKVLHFIDPSSEYFLDKLSLLKLEKLTQQENKEFRLVAKSAEAAIFIIPLSWQCETKIKESTPWDSDIKGKSLDWPPAPVKEAKNDNITAIVAAVWELRLILGVDENKESYTLLIQNLEHKQELSQLFQKRWKEAYTKNRFSQETFAEIEIREISRRLELIESLQDKKYYDSIHIERTWAKGYIDFLEKNEWLKPTSGMNYEGLLSELKKWLDMPLSGFKSLIEEGYCTPQDKGKWLGGPSDAYRFAVWLTPDGGSDEISKFNKNIELNAKGKTKKLAYSYRNDTAVGPTTGGEICEILHEYRKVPVRKPQKKQK